MSARVLTRQLFDRESSTYTYLLADLSARVAALVDPVLEQVERDLGLVRELGLELGYVLDTHVHADHVTAAGVLRERTGAQTVSSALGPACADVHVKHGDVIRLGEVPITVLATPGHTSDCVSYLFAGAALTGDTLLIRKAGRADFQNGDAGALYDSITRVLFMLPDETVVLPGHDYTGQTASTIGEEKRLNTRVAGRTRDEFIALMGSLNLPPPKRLVEVVPQNLACGGAPGSTGSTSPKQGGAS